MEEATSLSEKSPSENVETVFDLFYLEEGIDNEHSADFNLETFIKENYNDTITLLTRSNYNQLKRPLLVIFDHFQLKSKKAHIDKLYKVALKFPNRIQFAVAKEFKDIALFHFDYDEHEYLGFGSNVEPYVFAIDEDERQHYFKESYTIDALTYYCKQLAKCKLYHSDFIPTEHYVDTIVADNFKEILEQNEKDIFVTFHSDYSFKYDSNLWNIPISLVDDRDILVFYKINAQTNYIPLEFKVYELPTSFLIPRNDRSKRIRYEHNKYDFNNIKRFIAKNTSTELKTLDRKGHWKSKEVNPHVESNAERGQRKFDHTLNKLTVLIEDKFPGEFNDGNGFFKFLDNILNKVNEEEQDNIKMELLTLACNRVKEVLKGKIDA